MAFDTVASLVDALQHSKLLGAQQLFELFKLKPRFAEPWTLAEHLVRTGWVTIFQINQLSKGHGDSLILPPYVILDSLGEGGVSRVYKARHAETNKLVALKVIHPEMSHHPDAMARFHREMEMVAHLTHPNVVGATDVNFGGEFSYFAMDFVEGIDLSKLVQQTGPLPLDCACDYVRQAALGLQYIHEHGLVHRDIKPANLLLSLNDAVVKIVDLGLARLRQAPHKPGEPPVVLTREGIMIGTPDYLSPEQAKDPRNVDIRGDIYSLGCTFYYLLTGQAPFAGGTLVQKLFKHQQADPIRSDQLRPGMNPNLTNVVNRMMKKRPADRYQLPLEIAIALDPFCDLPAQSE